MFDYNTDLCENNYDNEPSTLLRFVETCEDKRLCAKLRVWSEVDEDGEYWTMDAKPITGFNFDDSVSEGIMYIFSEWFRINSVLKFKKNQAHSMTITNERFGTVKISVELESKQTVRTFKVTVAIE